MEKRNIGILTFPIEKAGIVPTSNLLEILHSISNNMYMITGNDGYNFFRNDKRCITYGIHHKKANNTVMRIVKFFYTQLKISHRMMKLSRKIDIWVFFIGGNTLLLPMFTAKLLRKKVILVLTGSSQKGFESTHSTLTNPIKFLENTNYLLSNRIVVYSDNIIKEWKLDKYNHKISIAYEHFLNFNLFKITNNFNQRKNLVGYIGRLSKEKGILLFSKAIEVASEKVHDNNVLEFIIAGDGELHDIIIKFFKDKNLNNKVKFIGWIPHDKLSDHLNELKLLVVPSYTEGLPNIVLEAMACGTPVLATPVGAIPDLITDKQTGFIIKKNDPTGIVEDILNILNISNMDTIIQNARDLVEKKYNLDICIKNFKKVIQKV